MRRPSAHALCTLALVAGCATGTGPGPIEDEYALVAVGGEALPARVANETWIADTLRFHEGGGWSRVSVVRLHGDGASQDPVRRTSDGSVTYRGDRIVLDFECNDVIVLASCVAPDTVRSSGDGLLRKPNHYGQPGADLLPLFRYEPVPR